MGKSKIQIIIFSSAVCEWGFEKPKRLKETLLGWETTLQPYLIGSMTCPPRIVGNHFRP
jgi:hypothetical protein